MGWDGETYVSATTVFLCFCWGEDGGGWRWAFVVNDVSFTIYWCIFLATSTLFGCI